MVRTKMSIEMKKLLCGMYVCLIFLVSAVAVSWAVPQDNASKPGCSLSKFLENPYNRDRYNYAIAKAGGSNTTVNYYENAAMYGVIAKSGFGSENGSNLDSFSAGCLSCHDGKSASNVVPNLKNSPDKKSVMKMISSKHSIGMDYEKYARSNSNLKSLDEMSQHINLAEGRVSCITCHDPLNSELNHLRITKTGTDLCSACHNV